MDKQKRKYHSLVSIAVLLALIVIILGAYTRLKDAGLGCPDWPGCYAQFSVPESHSQLVAAAQEFPGQVVEQQKAWLEMIHRYFAGSLALLVIVLGVWGLWRHKVLQLPAQIPSLLIGMIFFQAALGMWTVTLKLMPIIVMGHLLGGFTLLSLLWLSWLKTSPFFHRNILQGHFNKASQFRPWAVVGLVILIIQIALGGWTSSNYAALVCPGLPVCHGMTMPAWDVSHAFQLWTPFDDLSYAAKMTIQMFHRIGALVTFTYLLTLCVVFIAKFRRSLPTIIAVWVIIALFIQVALGLLNIILILPVPIAVAHNAMAALLLLTMITFTYSLFVE